MRPAVRTYGSRIKADNKNCAIIIEVTRQHPEYYMTLSFPRAPVIALWSVQRVDIACINCDYSYCRVELGSLQHNVSRGEGVCLCRKEIN